MEIDDKQARALEEVRAAVRERDRVRRLAHEADTELAAALNEAREAGVSVGDLMTITSLSRAGVYHVMAYRRGDYSADSSPEGSS